MRKAIMILASLVALALTKNPAEAAIWAMVGGGCVPDDLTIANKNYANGAGALTFKTGATGYIGVTCPVTVGQGILQGTRYVRDLYYRDSDGNSDGGIIISNFLKRNLRTGQETVVEGCESIHSGERTATGYNIIGNDCTHNFDPNGYMYYISVVLMRNNPNIDVRLYGSSIYRQ